MVTMSKTSDFSTESFSIILPAKNESSALTKLLPNLVDLYPSAEIIVVNDGSSDDTLAVCETHHVTCLTHPYSKGNGAAIKAGAKHASNDILVMMDADAQHRSEDVKRLLSKLHEGYDMVVCSRDFGSQASLFRATGNHFYNTLASNLVGQPIPDLTSGFRAVRRSKFLLFLPLLPNGFSYPSTITMAFFRSGFNVTFIPTQFDKRIGKSHLRPFKDGMRFLLIIFKITTLYSPLKIFFPIAAVHALSGIAYYLFTYATSGRFTNMGVTLLVSAVIIFLVGLISEQITTLLYAGLHQDKET